MADWKEILSNNDQQLTDEELLKYLNNNLPQEEKYVIEKKIAGDVFDSDALEGLQQINNPEKVKKQVGLLQQQLRHQLNSKRPALKAKKIKDLQWMVLTILLLLFICIFGYYLVHLHNKSADNQKINTESKI